MKTILSIYFIALLFPVCSLSQNEFIELHDDDPLHILLDGLMDQSLYPPQSHEEWSSSQVIKSLFVDYKYEEAVKIHKEKFGSTWANSTASLYGLLSASKIDSMQWFFKVYEDSPTEIQEKWKYEKWSPSIQEALGTTEHMDSLKIVQAKNLNKDLNDMLTLIMLEDISVRTSEGKMEPPEWVKNILEDEGTSYLLDKIRALPFPELSKSHWKQLDSLLSQNPSLNLENVGFLAKLGLEMSLLHSDPLKLPKHYKFIRVNVRPDLIAYFVDKALLINNSPQLFGTQVDMDKKRRVFTWQRIHDFENVNKFRMRLGMSTLEQYAKLSNVNYASEVEYHQKKALEKNMK